MANTLQYSLLEKPPDREVWQATVHRVMYRFKTFFACDSSAPVRIEHKGGTTAWLPGTLTVPSVQGHRLPLPQELRPYQRLLFEPLVPADQKASLASLSP